MWIVRLALNRPYTFVVMSILLLILGPVSILRTPTDIFPNIDIPVISVIWNYTGLSPEEMSNRIIFQYERVLTTTVNDIEHIESQSLNGIGLVKIFFHPGVQIGNAVAQVTAVSQTLLRQLPPGTTPPLVIQYNASSVPILQLALSGQGLSEQQLGDIGLNFVRTGLVSVPGAAIPYPYGGKQRQVQVDLDTNALQAKGLSPLDVVNAINNQNLILPAGTAKIGNYEYEVDMNGAPVTVAELNDLPIKNVGTTTIYIHDVANVRDGFPPQTNIVRVNGQRATLMTILKSGDVSTLDIISTVKGLLPTIAASLPPALKMEPLSDQSIFVKASITGVIREGLIAACLTGFMILVFLGSWRSTLIIAVSIPLSILTSIIVMSALGETINIMTLGGLALAVGILVDDATVEIENINRNIEQGKEIVQAILDGASQIAVPALVSTLGYLHRICADVFSCTGVARYLFVPLAEAVSFRDDGLLFAFAHHGADHGSSYLLAFPRPMEKENRTEEKTTYLRWCVCSRSSNTVSKVCANAITACLEVCIRHRTSLFVDLLFWPPAFMSFALLPGSWGRIFSPRSIRGEFKLHIRAPTGTRIEETAATLRPRRGFRYAKQIPKSGTSHDHRQHRPALQRH
jgi:multidrug efflux pump subunit AcrB